MQRIPYRKGSPGRLQGIAQLLVGRSSARKFEKKYLAVRFVQPARTARIVTYLEAIEAAGTDEGVEDIVWFRHQTMAIIGMPIVMSKIFWQKVVTMMDVMLGMKLRESLSLIMTEMKVQAVRMMI